MRRPLWAAALGTRLSRRSRRASGNCPQPSERGFTVHRQFKHGSRPGIIYVASDGACETGCWAVLNPAARQGGCWHQAPACPWTLLPMQQGAPGGPASSPQPSALPAPSLMAVGSQELLLRAGRADQPPQPQPRRGGSAVSEEDRGLVAKRREGTCTLLDAAALLLETTRRCQFFGRPPLTPGFHRCSTQCRRWGRSPDGSGAGRPPRCPSRSQPQDQAAVPSHPSPHLSCGVSARGLRPPAAAAWGMAVFQQIPQPARPHRQLDTALGGSIT